MKHEKTRALVTVITALAASSGAFAYTVVTRTGHTIHVQSRPEVRGPQAFMRLAPSGELAVIADGKIDWQRTEAVNPAAAPIAIPDSTMMTGVAAPKGHARPIEKKLYGGTTARVEPVVTPTTQTPQTAQKPNAGEAIVKLQKEYAQVAAARDTESAAKTMMEQELAQLQARDVGYASETSASQQRIRELIERINSSGSRINKLENRLNDIRSEVVQLGGVVD